MNYSDLDPKNLAETPRQSRRAGDIQSGNASGRGFDATTGQPVDSTAQSGGDSGKRPCLADHVSGFFNDVKGAITGYVNSVKDMVTGAINDVKAFGQALKNTISCIDLEFKLEKISLKGIVDDIKNAVTDGINDAINYAKGIMDAAKEFKSYLICEKGTAYEREEATIDDQLQRAGDESDAAGEAMTKANFQTGRAGTKTPMSARRRRDISTGTASGRAYVDAQVTATGTNTLNAVKNNARDECAGNNSTRDLQGMAESLNIESYG